MITCPKCGEIYGGGIMKHVTLKIKRSNISKMLAGDLVLPNKLDTIRNKSLLARTGAKLYYRGGGWWTLSGYASDGSDVNKLIVDCLL